MEIRARMELRVPARMKGRLQLEAAKRRVSLNEYVVYILRNRKMGLKGPVFRGKNLDDRSAVQSANEGTE